jgi:hypothetical protein
VCSEVVIEPEEEEEPINYTVYNETYVILLSSRTVRSIK